jgi:DNA-directed RNA polymerase specialized sigma24 family protein
MEPAPGRSDGVSETLTAPASQTGDTSWERFESLYRSSRDDVYAYVSTLLRDPAAAEDVTALAFERAYRRRRTFDRRRGEERAWLFGIARNAALDELRRRRRVAALQNALAKLPAREREIVALKFHAGMSNAELARVLGVSESNAGTLLYRTMEKLRKACNATA